MDFRVHHKSPAGLLVQLRGGGFGRLTKASCGGDTLADRLIQHANPQRDDIVVCAPTGETDADGYQVFSTDLRRTCSSLGYVPSTDVTAALLVDLAKRNALCGLGRQCRARVVASKQVGSVLRLSNGLNAVTLGAIEAPQDTMAAGDDDEATSAGGVPSHVNVRVLAYDEKGAGVVSCNADSSAVQRAHRSYTELSSSSCTADLAPGITRRCRVLLTVASNVVGIGDVKLAVATSTPVTEEAATTASVGHLADDLAGGTSDARDLLVYCRLPAKAAPIASGAVVSMRFTYVPSAAMLTATPFCLAVLESDASMAVSVGMPSSRIAASPADAVPVPVRLPWRDPELNAREAQEEAAGDDGAMQQKVRRRRLEEELDRFERQGETAPTSPEAFEKALLAAPNDSYLWTQFMAHHVSLRRVDAARNVAERALSRIPVTEAKQLLNVWVAYLNLENSFGTSESLAAVFRRAIERSDNTLEVHERLADIFAATGKKQQLVELCKTMSTKYRRESRVWQRLCDALVDSGKRDQLRRVFRDMKAVLTQKDQILVQVHAAVHEYKHGAPEHGRGLFESLVATAPKRSDIWSTYLDQERGLLGRGATEASVQGTRHIFERTATVQLPPKVMQSLLTQWLAFEQANGTPTTVQKVKDKARAYVEAKAAATAAAVGGP